MPKREKQLERLRNNPKNVGFDEFRGLLEYFGFTLKRAASGSHHIFEYNGVTIEIPYRSKSVKPIYVKLAIEAIDKVREQ